MAEPSATQPLPDVVDDSMFLDALHVRGLDAWVQQYQRDLAPGDDVGQALIRRQTLLDEAAAPGRTAEQVRSATVQAGDLLADLIQRHPEHAGRFRWQFELTRDLLERQCPAAFESVLLYELPGRHRATVKELSGRAIGTLEKLKGQISDAWKTMEAVDEGRLLEVRASGSLNVLESLQAQSTLLLAWARLYQAVASDLDAEQAKAAFAAVLDEVNRNAWLDLPPGREPEQAGALLMAAVAERRLGRFDAADSHAREIIALLDRIKDRGVRQRLRQTALLAVLEQIRATRDAGRADAALAGIEPARQWFLKNRPDDASAMVALGLLEASILQDAQIVSPADWLRLPKPLGALQRLAARSPAHRDLLYAVLAPALAGIAWQPSTTSATSQPAMMASDLFALQLLLGSAVADAGPGSLSDVSAARKRLTDGLTRARFALAAAVGQGDPQVVGEIRYLLGIGLALQQQRVEAVATLADLVEQLPNHDRAENVVRQAVMLAAEELRHSGPNGSPESRAAFVRAARLFRQHLPEDRAVAGLTYAVAVALENDGQFESAAEEYAAVPAGYAQNRAAYLARLRCLRHALDQASSHSPVDEAAMSVLAGKARVAVADAKAVASAPAAHDCSEAAVELATADVLNHPAVAGAEQAARLLQDFDTQFAACTDLLGPALRQRILALRQLKKLSEARGMIDRYLTADPENAGSVMAGLLQAMHDEMNAALQRGDATAAASVAGEAVQLGQSLIDWAAARPGRIAAGQLAVIRLWYASSLLQAGRAADALAAFEHAQEEGRTILPADSSTSIEIQLGRADALLAVGRATDSLAVFDVIWRQSPEQSEPWWHALVGSLQAHAQLDKDTSLVLASIRQQRFLAPDLGGGRWKHALENLEKHLATRPTQ